MLLKGLPGSLSQRMANMLSFGASRKVRDSANSDGGRSSLKQRGPDPVRELEEEDAADPETGVVPPRTRGSSDPDMAGKPEMADGLKVSKEQLLEVLQETYNKKSQAQEDTGVADHKRQFNLPKVTVVEEGAHPWMGGVPIAEGVADGLAFTDSQSPDGIQRREGGEGKSLRASSPAGSDVHR